MKPEDQKWCTWQLAEIRKLQVRWFGVPMKKCPLDLWIFQEIIAERKPEVIVEVGNLYGGSTLFLANLLDMLGAGEVIACDISREHYRAPDHPRITKVTGDIGNPKIVAQVKQMVGSRVCMVIHDAQHPCEPVLRDLKNLSPLVTRGQYFIVEDGVIDAAGWKPGQPGPLAACRKFMAGRTDFRTDRSRERYGITWNPEGYLERIA